MVAAMLQAGYPKAATRSSTAAAREAVHAEG